MKKIISYVILTFLLSIVGYYLVINAKSLGISPVAAVFYLMWCPAISAIIISLVYEKSLSGIGWRPGKLKWLGLAYLLPLVYAALAYGIIWLSGFGGINPNYKIGAFKLIIVGTIFNVAFALGEEIGWRGFLVPQLYKRFNFTLTCFITGIIWSVWHFPEIIGGAYLAKMPVVTQLLLLVITVTAMTFPISWLRLKSGSVWPAVLMHASHNLYVQWLFDPLTTETSAFSKYVIGESGIAMTVVISALAIFFWSMRKKLPHNLCRGAKS